MADVNKENTEKATKQRVQQAAPQTAQQPAVTDTGMQRAQSVPAGRGRGLMPWEPSFGPFALMRRLFDDLEQLTGLGSLGRLVGPSIGPAIGPAIGPMFQELEQTFERDLVFNPQVDVSRRGDKLLVHVDLPGVAPNEIEVTCRDGSLVIEGERHREHEGQEGDVWRSERMYGKFQRVIPLPENADLDNIEARFENGVLEISVKAPVQRAEGRKIEIKSGAGSMPESSDQTKH
jgi:HSP20 family protein